jgi:hypothetical protein
MNYDFSYFHKGCEGKYIVQAPDGLHVVCPVCLVSANLEAVSAKISASDACKVGNVERVPIGKLSQGVVK